MRWLVIVLAGCNQLYGLSETELRDAPGPDAPAVCPGDGSAPMFPLRFEQAFEQRCRNVTLGDAGETTKLAMAECFIGTTTEFSSGPVDGPLTKIDLDFVPPTGINRLLKLPRLVPEGNELWFVMYDGTTPGFRRIVAFELVGTRWTNARELPITIVDASFVGVPSLGPDRRVVIREGSEVIEYTDTGVEAGRYSLMELGVNFINEHVNLSEDARRIVFIGSRSPGEFRPFHAFRENRNVRFGRAEPLSEIDFIADPFLTNDCERLYFSGLNTILYAKLQ